LLYFPRDLIKMPVPFPVDLTTWFQESLETPFAGGFSTHGPPVWSPMTTSVSLGQINGEPSVFCSPDTAPSSIGYHMEGKMKVELGTDTDDDYFGFVVGYKMGDFTRPAGTKAAFYASIDPATKYYLIDWKQGDQDLTDLHNPCGGTAMPGVPAGLAISEVTGSPVESELWAHQDYASDTCIGAGAVSEKQRGDNFGNTGWVNNQEYDFCLEVTENRIKLTIDGVKEIEIAASVRPDTPFCFYAFSQFNPTWYDVTIEPITDAGGCGDPHFKTWHNEHFEYHGQCDLVLAQDSNFADGLGMDVHIRTKLVRHWSYIKNAVIRIGNDILEIEGSATEFDPDTHYWYNYEYQGELTEFAGFPVKMFSREGTAVTKNRIEIDLSSKYPGQKIVLSTYKEFIKVKFENASPESYGNTVGMLGDYNTGKTVGRDGVTEIHDFTDYGHEWQVLPADGKLFREASHPQFPELCVDPEDPRGDRKRRLAESSVSIEDAEAACATLKDELDRKDCVYDIIATQDMGMVGAY